MLISHTRKFIYMKTVKTAGTSVEVYLQDLCVPDEMKGKISERTNAIMTENGVVGARGADVQSQPFFNHMSAAQVKAKVGDEIWDEYRKLCVIRNPYDKVVSWFWMKLHPSLKAKIQTEGFEFFRSVFNNWLLVCPRLPDDKSVFMIKGQLVLDEFIRYESLIEDLGRVVSDMGFSEPAIELGRYKSAHRQFSEKSFRDYYSEDAAEVVSTTYATEFELFEYDVNSWR